MIDLEDFIVVVEDDKCSRKLYKMICDSCNLDRGYQRKHRHGMGLCKSCVATFLHKGKKYGEQTKQKMSDNHRLKNGFTHPMLGNTHSKETKAKISIATALQNKNYVAKHKYCGPGGTLTMKSSWEVKYAQYLDSNSLQWQYEPTFILSDGRAYLPDFQLSTGDIIEVKGYMREDARVKWDMFCSEHPELKKSLVTKVEMKQLGLI